MKGRVTGKKRVVTRGSRVVGKEARSAFWLQPTAYSLQPSSKVPLHFAGLADFFFVADFAPRFDERVFVPALH
jgi:hypothetical protein